jgi:hypothetical protein
MAHGCLLLPVDERLKSDAMARRVAKTTRRRRTFDPFIYVRYKASLPLQESQVGGLGMEQHYLCLPQFIRQ